jgi:hypothetical protein
MRLKYTNRQPKILPLSIDANLNRPSMNEDSRNDIMNGSNSSTGSASALGGNDDLEQLEGGDVIFVIS